MSGPSDWLQAEILKWITGQTNSLGAAPTPYLRLWTTLPGADGTGGVEVTGGGYTAQAVTGDWAAPSGGTVATSVEVSFGVATASWGTIVGWSLESAASAGDQFYAGAFTGSATYAVAAGDTVRFDAGALTLTVT